MMLQVGDQFDHFQIRDHMAQGGMGDIYRATDLLTGNEVVLKVPNQMMIGDPAQYERFQRELEVMNTLHHPALQKGLGSGQYNRTPYLVTELVKGRSMRDLIDKEAPLPVERAVSLTRKIADGMAYCHEHEVIHRDLKPENILISDTDQPVILDFGLALTKGGHRVTYANLTGMAGTPDYMSPEQIEGQRGDARTDIYAVGTMMYEMLMGRTPFTGDNQTAIISQHLQGIVPRLDKDRPGISPQIASIVARTLQRNPDDRYPTMRDLINDLDHPEAVDISILDKATGTASKAPFWKSQTFSTFATIMVFVVIIVVLVVVAAVFRGPH